MSTALHYQVLARKWRPHCFADMVGQAPILRMLANALEQKRIHHAYLLTGTRGVGKTTLARIFAKCLNCETGITATPCDACANCQAIDQGRFLDLYEVDAASRTKVEDTRELLDNVLYPPTQGRYKIYLIDEVHMLSNHSFNALLKTLEEPPEHVKFLLATTDPKRLPITVLSRCLQFHLKRISPENITDHLDHICRTENLKADKAALEKLAHAADGSMRDALSLLDQAIAYGHGAVNISDVNAMLGSMTQDDLIPLLEALAAQAGDQLFTAIHHLADCAPDFQQVLEELIALLHKIAILQCVPKALPGEASLLSLSQRFTPEEIQLYYQIALLGRRDLALTPLPQQGFEMTLLRMLAFKPSVNGPDQATPNKIIPSTAAASPTLTIPSTPPAMTTLANTNSTHDWRSLLAKLELSGMAYALASNCTLESITDNTVVLALAANHEPLLNAKLKERIAQALAQHLKHSVQLDILIKSRTLLTPVMQANEEQAQRLTQATQTIMADSHIQQLIAMYDATVSISLIKT